MFDYAYIVLLLYSISTVSHNFLIYMKIIFNNNHIIFIYSIKQFQVFVFIYSKKYCSYMRKNVSFVINTVEGLKRFPDIIENKIAYANRLFSKTVKSSLNAGINESFSFL